MSAPYRLAPLVVDDLVETWESVRERFGEAAADRVFQDLVGAFELLAGQPGIGHVREELHPPPWRFWPVGPSLIAYRGDVSPIWIARVTRGERHWPELEFEDPDGG